MSRALKAFLNDSANTGMKKLTIQVTQNFKCFFIAQKVLCGKVPDLSYPVRLR